MKYDIELIEKRVNIQNRVKFLVRKIIFTLIIVMLYNVFLISKSSLSKEQAKDVFGYKAYIITTDSMKPNINSGDVIIVTKVKEEKIKSGDIITFKTEDDYISHRIIEIKQNEEEIEYITKGDNNNVPDSYRVVYDDIEGCKIIRIPLLGNLILMLRNKIYIVILIIIILLIYLYTRKIEYKKKARREKKENEDKKNYNSDDSN